MRVDKTNIGVFSCLGGAQERRLGHQGAVRDARLAMSIVDLAGMSACVGASARRGKRDGTLETVM